jgi:hypothetical protein
VDKYLLTIAQLREEKAARQQVHALQEELTYREQDLRELANRLHVEQMEHQQAKERRGQQECARHKPAMVLRRWRQILSRARNSSRAPSV